jgi:predicted glycosyltransferase
MASKQIWIDLDNSPHVPFFAPIIEALEQRGYGSIVTSRDAYQVYELADLFQLRHERIGRHYGKNKAMKVFGTCARSVQLMSYIRSRAPQLAVSHGSRSQVMAAGFLRIPSLTIIDYEFTASTVLFRPTWALVPEIVAGTSMQSEQSRVFHYRGIKEDVYVPFFEPDPTLLPRLGIPATATVVTVRPPASEAHYHAPASDTLFAATMERLAESPDVRVVLLPRNSRQELEVRARWPKMFESGQASIPAQAEKGLNIIWYSDLVISGGGTMNREAAALGVPVYSIFGGKIGAVDKYLQKQGRLHLLESAADVKSRLALVRRNRSQSSWGEDRTTLNDIVDRIVRLAEHREAPDQ